ncbi:MAG: lipid-binding SYLF domain-containing protein [Pseudomonadota bacterium]
MGVALKTVWLVVLATVLATGSARADRKEKAEDLVSDAAVSIDYFANDRNYRAMWRQAQDAAAIVVIPRSVRAGFVFGGSGGNGAMIARRENGWSEPAFLRISSFSFGLQAGGEVSEIILLIMTKEGMDSLLSTSVKLGADLTIAAGPLGGGAKAQTADVLAYSRSQGLYGSISIEGGVLKVNRKWNEAYYGAPVSPADIFYLGKAANPKSSMLKAAASRLLAKSPN